MKSPGLAIEGMIVVLSACLSLLCLPQTVIGSDWACIDPSGEVCARYYDKVNVKYSSGNIVRVWLKVTVDEEKRNQAIKDRTENGYSVEGWDKWSHTVYIDEMECIKKIYRTLNSFDYDSNGNVLEQSEYEEKRWMLIPPDTVENRLYDKVCSPTEDKRKETKK